MLRTVMDTTKGVGDRWGPPLVDEDCGLSGHPHGRRGSGVGRPCMHYKLVDIKEEVNVRRPGGSSRANMHS